jgi:uncharacterized protein
LKILYLHGLGSNSQSTAAALRNEQFNVLSPDYSPEFYQESICMLQALITDERIELIVGTSMGGFYALKLCELTGIPAVAINACFEPDKHLPKYLNSPAINYDTGDPIVFDNIMIGIFEPLRSDHMPSPKIIIGRKDDIIPAEYQRDFCRSHGWSWTETDWGHRVGDGGELTRIISG